MKKEQLKNIKADEPLSLTDAAPPVIELDCGVRVRLPGFGDYRIVQKVVHDIKECDETDEGMIMLYCAMHTTKAQIMKIWKLGRNPRKLYDAVIAWQMNQSAVSLMVAFEELSEYLAEADEQSDLDGDDDESGESDAKKKTG